MKQLLLVFFGGGLGSAVRYAIGKYLQVSSSGFPYATFTVNIIGCLLMGLVLGWATKIVGTSQQMTVLLATGFCGGFTTFSAFAYENQQFLKAGDFSMLAIYTVASFSLGILAVFLGMYLIRTV